MSEDRTPDDTGKAGRDDADGQISELAMGGAEPSVISPGDAVAGSPDGESGHTQEGAAGPNAIPVDETDQHPHEAAPRGKRTHTE